MKLLYRAGSRALAQLRAEGLGAGKVSALVGPATGPRWLAFARLDWAVHQSGLLTADEQGRRVLLVGASAGAWRMAALATAEPEAALDRLCAAYIQQSFDPDPSPAEVTAAYRRLLAQVFPNPAAGYMLTHPERHLGIITSRSVRSWPKHRPGQLLLFARAFANNALRPSALARSFRRTLLCAHPGAWPRSSSGDVAPLTPRNLHDALLASGSVPGYFEPIQIPDAPAGDYLDGGVTDYHLAQRVTDRPIVLLPHHGPRVAATWFDKHLPWRQSSAELLEDVLVIYPSPDYIRCLPGSELPDRQDFHRFRDAPGERMRRWSEAVARSEELAHELLDDLRSGRVAQRAERIG
ncbi:MAG: patatin-like phospholipase family protein [Polyangiaceae bacterium]|nr:patatin-like phospholipase family protein [Polyangiaceae bacterium]